MPIDRPHKAWLYPGVERVVLVGATRKMRLLVGLDEVAGPKENPLYNDC